MENAEKPPIGLIPKWQWNNQRLDEVKDAISRYYNAYKPIPLEWIVEYNELIETKFGKQLEQ